MFSLFRKKETVIPYANAVYKTQEMRRTALIAAVKNASHPVVIIFHFPEERMITENLFRENALPFYYPGSGVYTGITAEHPLLFLDADTFCTYCTNLSAHTVLIAEHHPRWSEDKKLLDAIAQVPVKNIPVFFVGLDEPFIRHYGGDRIARLMEAMGMKEDEMISHDLVDKSIQKAQEKTDKKSSFVPADSQEQWMRMNIQLK